ncbi:MAG: hypothetical protein C0625_05500 [Arcobacter sp.]|nr:MAG: hypothetical protein C0625_05500 [Arcobacter sp.]
MNKNIGYYKDLIKKHLFTFIGVFTVIFAISIAYAYYAQRIYQSEATVEIINYQQNVNTINNPLQIAVEQNSPEDEAEILKSNLLIDQAINNLNFNMKFYHAKNNKNFAIDHMEFPLEIKIFTIKKRLLYDKKIEIIPLDENSYKFSTDSEEITKFDEVYTYGQLIDNEIFTLQLNKKIN